MSATALRPAHSRIQSTQAFLLTLAVLFASTIAQPSTAAAQKTPKLVMGYPTPGAGITIEVIRRAGFFKKHGLDVDLVLLSGSSLLATAIDSPGASRGRNTAMTSAGPATRRILAAERPGFAPTAARSVA